MNAIKADAAAILAGATLRVVLHPDPGVQTDFPDMIEGFALRHVLTDGERLLGMTSSRHALGYKFDAYDPHTAYSYAYTDIARVVINVGLKPQLFRAYHARNYLEIRFVARPTHEVVWEWGKDGSIAAVEAAVRDGRALRVALQDESGLWNVHPVEMPSYYVGKDFFELFTEQESMPAVFRDFAEIRKLERSISEAVVGFLKQGKTEKDAYKFAIGTERFETDSCYYTVRSNGEYLKGAVVIRDEQPLRYRALKVFAERMPA